MKITVTTIEASAEDLRANRSVADALMDALSRAFDAVARPSAEAEKDSIAEEDSITEEQMDGSEHGF